LQDRVEAAVKKAGGNVLSSQIDLQGPHSAEGFIGLTESLEIDQASLQPLLYDLEAGMPYLFVEKGLNMQWERRLHALPNTLPYEGAAFNHRDKSVSDGFAGGMQTNVS
jgi:hypothetical protein